MRAISTLLLCIALILTNRLYGSQPVAASPIQAVQPAPLAQAAQLDVTVTASPITPVEINALTTMTVTLSNSGADTITMLPLVLNYDNTYLEGVLKVGRSCHSEGVKRLKNLNLANEREILRRKAASE